MKTIQVSNVSYTTHSLQILDKISLTAEEGQITALPGHNDSGKSFIQQRMVYAYIHLDADYYPLVITSIYNINNLKQQKMKKIIFLTIALIYCSFKSVAFKSSSETESENPTDILDSIQHKIEYAMYECFAEESTTPLDKIYDRLKQLKPENNVITYWMAYVNYYQSVFLLKTNDKKKSDAKIKNGIVLLEKLQKKNSEDYALLALLQSFSIQFKSGMAAGGISAKVAENGEKSIELDDSNLRAWYVLGSNDFYTPESFGGGKKVETYLKKAISLPSQSRESTYLPSWGKEYAFELLIQYYIKKDKKEEAKKIFEQAIQLFPNSYMLKPYESKF